jgi:hypothetical protein
VTAAPSATPISRDFRSTVSVTVSQSEIEAMDAVVQAVESLVALPAYRKAVLQYAPPIAHDPPGPLGGLLGFDFHLGPYGPSLIEINTNAGGILLCDDGQSDLEQELLAMYLTEWALADRDAPLKSVAIVDEEPQGQFLYPEFVALQALFQRHGIEAKIVSPQQLSYESGRLLTAGNAIDLVVNRLTDFILAHPRNDALRQAYLDRAVVVTPHPHAHALYADKRNMTILGDRSRLVELQVAEDVREILQKAIPPTRLVTDENADLLWEQRRQLYFKPAHGYGSKGVYQGQKMTRRVWTEILQQGGYVAQQLVPPSRVTGPAGELKVDLRYFVYNGDNKLRAARLYRGQTTNLRTPHGGFARVHIGQ